ncbi:MAG: ribulose-phosphate 3-epimerase [Clostridiales bacterium]|nr:ribulose-phosphate 3-epimerase [Clostridiales bacterium]
MKRIKLAPSILAADFARLGDQIRAVEQADYLHVDVMDGVFVPNISLGQPVLASVRQTARLPLDVHLMIIKPERYLESFAWAGADILTVHAEACEDLPAALDTVKRLGKKAGVTIKPGTPAEALEPALDLADLILVMSVEPGFGGQDLQPDALAKAEKIANLLEQRGLSAELEMDGGIYLHNVRDVLNAGVNVIVAGSAVFGQTDPAAAVADFYRAFAAKA